MTSPRTLAIVVNWNGAGVLEKTIESLCPSGSAAGGDILIVDNASTDGSAEAAVWRFPGVELIRLPENRGFAGGHNEGLRRAIAGSYDYALLLNNDITLEAGALESLLQAAEQDPLSAILAPSVWRADDSRRMDVAWGNILFHHVIVQMKAVNRIPAAEHLRKREADCVFGSVLLVRMTAVQKAGLLDERYWMFLEEVEFCRRMRQWGYRILYLPEARAVHIGGHSIKKASAQRLKLYLIRRNSVLFMKRYAGWKHWLWYLACVAGSLAVSMVICVLGGNWRSWLARWEGYRDGFCGRLLAPRTLWQKYISDSPVPISTSNR